MESFSKRNWSTCVTKPTVISPNGSFILRRPVINPSNLGELIKNGTISPMFIFFNSTKTSLLLPSEEGSVDIIICCSFCTNFTSLAVNIFLLSTSSPPFSSIHFFSLITKEEGLKYRLNPSGKVCKRKDKFASFSV